LHCLCEKGEETSRKISFGNPFADRPSDGEQKIQILKNNAPTMSFLADSASDTDYASDSCSQSSIRGGSFELATGDDGDHRPNEYDLDCPMMAPSSAEEGDSGSDDDESSEGEEESALDGQVLAHGEKRRRHPEVHPDLLRDMRKRRFASSEGIVRSASEASDMFEASSGGECSPEVHRARRKFKRRTINDDESED
jgi:hypothetical protein